MFIKHPDGSISHQYYTDEEAIEMARRNPMPESWRRQRPKSAELSAQVFEAAIKPHEERLWIYREIFEKSFRDAFGDLYRGYAPRTFAVVTDPGELAILFISTTSASQDPEACPVYPKTGMMVRCRRQVSDFEFTTDSIALLGINQALSMKSYIDKAFNPDSDLKDILTGEPARRSG